MHVARMCNSSYVKKLLPGTENLKSISFPLKKNYITNSM